jgi:hypothetical protein
MAHPYTISHSLMSLFHQWNIKGGSWPTMLLLCKSVYLGSPLDYDPTWLDYLESSQFRPWLCWIILFFFKLYGQEFELWQKYNTNYKSRR